MKKILSVLLALMLCCLLLPAAAEDVSLVGTWYIAGAFADGGEIHVLDPEAIVLTLNEDNTGSMGLGAYGAASDVTWSVADGVLTLVQGGEEGEQKSEFVIKGETLEFAMGNTSVTMARTPAVPYELPAVVPAESADAFAGNWVPYAQISTGLYGVMNEETAAQMGRLSIEGTKVASLYDAGDGTLTESSSYDAALTDGILVFEDNSMFPTKVEISLLEDGSLFYNSVMAFGEEMSIQLAMIYVPAE